MADGAAAAVFPMAVVRNPFPDRGAVLGVEVVGLLTGKSGDAVKRFHRLIEETLLLVDPLPFRVDPVVPCHVLGEAVLAGMIEDGVAIVGIRDGSRDQLVGDL